MKLCIVGTGYVGLVSGVCLAIKGHQVTCVDIDPLIIKKINSKKPPIYEKNLPKLLAKVISLGNFRATTNLDSALKQASIVMIAVGTPSDNEHIDLSYIESALSQIGEYIRNNNQYISIIVKSTVLPGTTDTFIRKILEKSSGKKLGEFGLGMNPEFLREGEAINDFLYPDRIVLGFENLKTKKHLEELYKPWIVDKIFTNTRTAELIKYANNTLLATQISTVNELANLSSKLGGINIKDVINGVQLDKRWNPILNKKRVRPDIIKYLVPGCGFGGSCFSKDLKALRFLGHELDLNMRMISSVLETNNEQPHQVINILKNEIGNLKGKHILLLGLAFKPGTDDVRESPALKIAADVIKSKAILYAHDPVAVKNFKKALKVKSDKMKFVENWVSTLKLIEIIIIVSPWDEYLKLIDIDISDKVIFDTRGAFNSANLNALSYLSISGKL
jgi:UDPglucose 6-dehydrogenase/GDP-mannose 6-dehydrogenase